MFIFIHAFIQQILFDFIYIAGPVLGTGVNKAKSLVMEHFSWTDKYIECCNSDKGYKEKFFVCFSRVQDLNIVGREYLRSLYLSKCLKDMRECSRHWKHQVQRPWCGNVPNILEE